MEQITVFVEIGDNVKQVLLPIANQSGVEAADAIVRIIKESIKNKSEEFVQREAISSSFETIPKKIEVTFKIPTIHIHHM